jgi:ankyrin repeat protein
MSGVCECGEHITTQTLFSKATQFKDLEFMKDLIFVNPSIIEKKDQNNDLLLNHAIKKEWVELIMLLIENGFDPNKKDKNKNTLLHIAIQIKSISFVEALQKWKNKYNDKK